MADQQFSGNRFKDKVALVTGAASGMGRAITLRVAGEGGRVFAHDVNPDGLAETAKLAADAGVSIETRAGDVTNVDECRAAVAACIDAFGRLDVLANVAGIARGEHFTDVTEADYRRMMAINVDAYFFFAQAAIPHLLATEGNIVNIASNAGLMGQAYTVAYCMSKGAVVQFTKALAMEYVKTPLRVNAIAPGGTDTSLTSNYQMPTDADWDLVGRYSGFRGMGSADDIAALFALVASDEGRSIHGTILSCDRGITAG